MRFTPSYGYRPPEKFASGISAFLACKQSDLSRSSNSISSFYESNINFPYFARVTWQVFFFFVFYRSKSMLSSTHRARNIIKPTCEGSQLMEVSFCASAWNLLINTVSVYLRTCIHCRIKKVNLVFTRYNAPKPNRRVARAEPPEEGENKDDDARPGDKRDGRFFSETNWLFHHNT